MSLFDTFNSIFLSMDWLNQLVGSLLTMLGIDITQPLGSAVQFFFYDVIKIFILLSVLIFGISYIQSYFPPERTKKILSRFKGITANTMSALLGTITPFCSCSSIPLFMGFTSAGLPIGVTFSFLISSPLVDLASVIMLAGIFNWNVSLSYVITGLLLAIISGTLLSKMKLEKYIEPFVLNAPSVDLEIEELTKQQRISFAKQQVIDIVKKVWLYIIIGVGIGATIHNFIPQEIIEQILGDGNPFSVILAVLVGIPMYADIFGTLPIAEALLAKGVGLGTVLAFMMSVTALSLPSLIMLKRIMKKELLAIFVAIVTVGIILIGYLFNYIGPYII